MVENSDSVVTDARDLLAARSAIIEYAQNWIRAPEPLFLIVADNRLFQYNLWLLHNHLSYLLNTIRALSFDLDNTLWEVGPVMVRAEQVLLSWFKDNLPAHAQHFTVDAFREVRLQVGLDYPEHSHDFTILRRLSLERVIQTYGYEQEWVEQAMEVFLSARNDVTLFDDVLPCLEILRHHFPMISISNGNADVQRIGIDHFFKHSIHARHVGVAKPNLKIFKHACDQLKFEPSDVLHIGDHPIEDVQGAAEAGLNTAWINRNNTLWDYDHQPDHAFTELTALVNKLLNI